MTNASRTMGARVLALLALLSTGTAAAHEQAGVAGGLASGLLHPLTGADHLVAMVAVGLWGAALGSPALWLLPITFPLIMALGGVLGVLGVPLPVPEVAIALSAIVLGGAVALRWRPAVGVATAVVAVFAVFHGHAHGVELPKAANPLAYGIGFVIATGSLHLCGIALGSLCEQRGRAWLVPAAGYAIALVGGYFLLRAVGVTA